jgi:hypothetical protein
MPLPRLRLTLIALASTAVALLPGLAPAEAPTTQPATVAIDPQKVGGNKFLRFVDDETSPLLQTSIITYETPAGVKVHLIGAVHVGDRDYYNALNEEFKNYQVVLYEMVKPPNTDMKKVEAPKKPDFQMRMIHNLQRLMQEHLQLEFQLDDIDYTAANFVHADLDSETFRKMQEERGESMMRLMLNAMLKELTNPRAPTGNEPSILDIIDALSAPDSSRRLKIVLARQFQDIDRAMNSLGGESGSVILDERNKHCLKVLREQIDAGKTNIAIFYGAGHYPGMEKLMVELMGFKQVGEPRWITAWDMTARPIPADADKEPVEDAPATQPAR